MKCLIVPIGCFFPPFWNLIVLLLQQSEAQKKMRQKTSEGCELTLYTLKGNRQSCGANAKPRPGCRRCDSSGFFQPPSVFAFVFSARRPLHHHLGGGDAPVRQADDRQRRDHLDRVLLLLVVHLRVRLLHPAHPERGGAAPHLHASHAPEPLGDLHGRWARHLGLAAVQTPGAVSEVLFCFWVFFFRLFSLQLLSL